ncbi:MAG TPA: response regulator, partial [Gemmatimonadaceae bacterium]|nr:response regulator [Gemmatimonadaceae bacterium]
GEPYVTTRADRGGTGLGLFVTRGLVDAHGGSVQLGNHDAGGAEVRFRLPPAPADAAPVAATPADAATPFVAARVLVVDDEPELLAAMRRVAERLGHHVTMATDGEEALGLARAEDFDVIVSDLMMPRMSGAELAAQLAEHAPALRRRFIVMTGGAVTAEDDAFLQREDVLVINKPVRMQALGAMIARALATPLLLLLVLTGCARSGPRIARDGLETRELPPAGADSVRVERVSPATRLLQLTWLPRDDRAGPWRGSVLEVDLRACVTLGAAKGGPTAVGRTRTSALLAALPASSQAVAAVNADFFSFTPAGVPTGAHVEAGRVLSGPGARPVVAVDSSGALHLGRLRATGWVAYGDERVGLTAWNRWPSGGLTLLDAAWGVPLDSTADSAGGARAVRLTDERVRVVAVTTMARAARGVVATGDTVLLVAPLARSGATARALLAARRSGDTLAVRVALAPVAPREAVGGFPVLLTEGRRSPTLATDGAASFRGVNPRSAIGWSRAGDRLWLVGAGGRQPTWSVGATTPGTAG